ncbi:hypothetical protein BKA56DRAFT_93629 [Ilyonectria sp. MPI-CAGE-AT-0026]|nr:hypothetical protein BKA56DRAFT_93629 [Ilyonectria sp. MPI-CAGE-AT-0026]
MAEALGLVSSIIAVVGVAGKLGTSALKLKRLWDEVQDVPEQIQMCIEQLEMLAPALQEMESEFQRTRNMVDHDSAGKLSLKYCQKATASLEGMVQDMQQQIESARKGKRTLARLKIRLKKGVVEEHQKRLQSALQFLSLSQQTFLIALTRMQPSIMISEFRALRAEERTEEGLLEVASRINTVEEQVEPQQLDETGCVNNEASLTMLSMGKQWTQEKQSFAIESIPWRRSMFPCTFSYQQTEVDAKSESIAGSSKIRVHQARIQFPPWLLKKAWDFQAFQASHGWTFHLKPWITRPENSQAFEYVKQGRSDLLLQAFERNEASLYDRHPSGETLLSLAIRYLQPELMSILSTMGLKVSDASEDAIIRCMMEKNSFAPKVRMELQLFSIWSKEDGFGHEFDGLGRRERRPFYQWLLSMEPWCSPGVLDLILDTDFPHYNRIIPNSWFSFLPWICLDPQLLLGILKRDRRVSPAVFRAQVGNDITWFLFSYLRDFFHKSGDEVREWRSLARWLFTGASASEVASAQGTATDNPLLSDALEKHWEKSFVFFCPSCRQITKAISMWLEDLAEVGVDIEEYIKQEIGIGRGVPDIGIGTQIPQPIRFRMSGPSLVLMERGSCQEDWRFEWDPLVEALAGEFWRLVDDPQWQVETSGPMPGAWPDDR